MPTYRVGVAQYAIQQIMGQRTGGAADTANATFGLQQPMKLTDASVLHGLEAQFLRSALAGPIVAPTYPDVQVLAEGSGNRSFPAVTVAVGDWLVVEAIAETGGSTNLIPSGGGLSYNVQNNADGGGGRVEMWQWTSTQVSSAGSVTVLISQSGFADNYRGQLTVVRGSGGPGGKALNTTAQTVSLARQQAQSGIFMAVGDWTVTAVGSPSWTPGGATTSSQQGTAGTYIFGRWDNSGAAGTASTGITSPSYTTPSVCVLEMLGLPGSGASTVTGASDTALTFSAPASGRVTKLASSTTSFTLDAPASGRVIRRGVAATTMVFASPAAGLVRHPGTSTTALGFTAPAAGVSHGPTVSGTATGLLGFSAPALARVTRRASSVTALTFSAPASARVIKRASSVTTLTFQAPALGRSIKRATALGAFTFSAPASGRRTVRASASCAVTFLAPASGQVGGAPQTVTGSATGLLGFAAPALGLHKVVGLAGASVSFGAPAQGRRRVLGTSATTISFSTLASAKRSVRASATAILGFLAPAQGPQPDVPSTPGTVAAGNGQAGVIVYPVDTADSIPVGPLGASAGTGTRTEQADTYGRTMTGTAGAGSTSGTVTVI